MYNDFFLLEAETVSTMVQLKRYSEVIDHVDDLIEKVSNVLLSPIGESLGTGSSADLVADLHIKSINEQLDILCSIAGIDHHGVVTAGESFWEGVGKTIKAVWDAIYTLLAGIINFIKSLFGFGDKSTKKSSDNMKSTAKDSIKKVEDDLKAAAKKAGITEEERKKMDEAFEQIEEFANQYYNEDGSPKNNGNSVIELKDEPLNEDEIKKITSDLTEMAKKLAAGFKKNVANFEDTHELFASFRNNAEAYIRMVKSNPQNVILKLGVNKDIQKQYFAGLTSGKEIAKFASDIFYLEYHIDYGKTIAAALSGLSGKSWNVAKDEDFIATAVIFNNQCKAIDDYVVKNISKEVALGRGWVVRPQSPMASSGNATMTSLGIDRPKQDKKASVPNPKDAVAFLQELLEVDKLGAEQHKHGREADDVMRSISKSYETIVSDKKTGTIVGYQARIIDIKNAAGEDKDAFTKKHGISPDELSKVDYKIRAVIRMGASYARYISETRVHQANVARAISYYLGS